MNARPNNLNEAWRIISMMQQRIEQLKEQLDEQNDTKGEPESGAEGFDSQRSGS